MDQTVIALLFVPAKTPHTSTEITTDQIVYLVVRVDPHRVLRAEG
jgi:uncharacterized RmlC-like cupin family protein